MSTFKVVGRAVATKRGHYPQAGGGSRVIVEGEAFDVIEGWEKATWFKLVEATEPAAEPTVAHKGKKAKQADDLA